MFKQLINKYRNTTDLNRFLLKGGTLFFVWRIFRKWMILEGQYTDFTQFFSSIYLWLAQLFLKIFQYDTQINYVERKLWISGSSNAIEVVYDCLGVNLFFVFLIFMLSYPGKIKIKAWLIPLGLFVIFVLNAMRMAALTPIVAYYPNRMDFFHHFVFQGIIYIAIFGMWWWFTKLDNNKKAGKN